MSYKSYQRSNFFWAELLSKAIVFPFLAILLLLLIAQASNLKEGLFPAPSAGLPASDVPLEEIPFYR